MDYKFKSVSSALIRPEDCKYYRSGRRERYSSKFREKDLIEEFEKDAERLGLFFNGMQERINDQLPLALFTDKETKSTFGLEPGQKLSETRKRFCSVQNQF
ncbi:MAG: hypothetical protein HY787_06250 [Deltaproteobacteria bacterium]|nr:hypothetical protein [Deltaproteobacteria bacterium]